MQEKERQAWIWLSAVNSIGVQTLLKVQEQLKIQQLALDDIWHFSAHKLERLLLKEKQIVAFFDFKKEFSPAGYLEMLATKKIEVMCWDDDVYPDLLREIPDHPLVLYFKGPADFWRVLPISVVGTRHLSPYGELATTLITRELVEYNATIISGFMYGADLLAHQTAIRERGKTVGVLGYGFDYLPLESELYQTEFFLDSGNTFLTEFPPFVTGKKGNFPIRNRIVAGMSHATVVTEAAQKSGSLITAERAIDYGRLVCAVPGPLTSIYSEGTKFLINQGAKLVTSGSEIFEEICPSLENSVKFINKKKMKKIKTQKIIISTIDQQIINIIKSIGSSVDDIAERLNLEITDAVTRLSILEVNGLVKKVGNKWWSY